MKGSVKGYFDRAFDEMTDRELETTLANIGMGLDVSLDLLGKQHLCASSALAGGGAHSASGLDACHGVEMGFATASVSHREGNLPRPLPDLLLPQPPCVQ